MNQGDVLKVLIDNPRTTQTLPAEFKAAGNPVLKVEEVGKFEWEVVVRKEK